MYQIQDGGTIQVSSRNDVKQYCQDKGIALEQFNEPVEIADGAKFPNQILEQCTSFKNTVYLNPSQLYPKSVRVGCFHKVNPTLVQWKLPERTKAVRPVSVGLREKKAEPFIVSEDMKKRINHYYEASPHSEKYNKELPKYSVDVSKDPNDDFKLIIASDIINVNSLSIKDLEIVYDSYALKQSFDGIEDKLELAGKSESEKAELFRQLREANTVKAETTADWPIHALVQKKSSASSSVGNSKPMNSELYIYSDVLNLDGISEKDKETIFDSYQNSGSFNGVSSKLELDGKSAEEKAEFIDNLNNVEIGGKEITPENFPRDIIEYDYDAMKKYEAEVAWEDSEIVKKYPYAYLVNTFSGKTSIKCAIFEFANGAVATVTFNHANKNPFIGAEILISGNDTTKDTKGSIKASSSHDKNSAMSTTNLF